MLKPLEDRVVIEVAPPPEVTKGGIVLPDNLNRSLGMTTSRGVVKAAGPGRMTDTGVRLPMHLSVGDEVLFAPYTGAEVEVDGKKFMLCRASDVLAKF